MNARSLWLTPQTTTPYVHAEADVKDGPVVIEIGTPVLGLVNDAFFRYVTDLGVVGADKGKGRQIPAWWALTTKGRSPKDISSPRHRPTVTGR